MEWDYFATNGFQIWHAQSDGQHFYKTSESGDAVSLDAWLGPQALLSGVYPAFASAYTDMCGG